MFGNIAVIKKSGIEYFNFFDAITDEEAFGRTGLSQDNFVNVIIGDNVIRKHFFVDKGISFGEAFEYAGIENDGVTIFDCKHVSDDKKFEDFAIDNNEKYYLLKIKKIINGHGGSPEILPYSTMVSNAINEIKPEPKPNPTGMIAILCYVDGFGNDTCVKSIHKNMDDAKRKHAEDIKENPNAIDDLWVEFEFGDVDFDIYSSNSYSFDD